MGFENSLSEVKFTEEPELRGIDSLKKRTKAATKRYSLNIQQASFELTRSRSYHNPKNDSQLPQKRGDTSIRKCVSSEHLGVSFEEEVSNFAHKVKTVLCRTFSFSSVDSEEGSKVPKRTVSESSQEDVEFSLSSDDESLKVKGMNRSISPFLTSPQFGSPTEGFIHFLEKKADFGCSLFGKEKKQVDNATKHLKELPDSPRGKTKGRKLSLVLHKFVDVLGHKISPKKKEFHQNVHHVLEDSPWAKDVMKELRHELKECRNIPTPTPTSFEDLPRFIINIEHITQGGSKKTKAAGFHFCPKGHPMSKKLERVQTHPQTGVFCAYFKFDRDKEFKFSSFFPKEIKTPEEIIEMIQNSTEVARQGNRSLREVKGNKHFLIEVYFKEGMIVNSAFPIFYSASFEEGKIFQLTDTVAIDSNSLLKEAESYVQKNQMKAENLNPVRFILKKEQEVIVDVAPIFEKQTGIKNGIYIRFPLSKFPFLS